MVGMWQALMAGVRAAGTGDGLIVDARAHRWSSNRIAVLPPGTPTGTPRDCEMWPATAVAW